ncbi:MAG: trypsin-like peptidase domain-containing protein [Pseudobdellovibrionaceae bacterium]
MKTKIIFISTFSLILLTVVLGLDTTGIAQQMALPKNPPVLKLSDPLPANLFVELGRVINPTVVNISTAAEAKINRDPMLDMLEQFYGMRLGPQAPTQRQQMGLGTGFIIREDGLIITNNHVVAGADIINVQLTEKNNKIYTAKLIGSDDRSDIALIKIQPEGKLPVATLGSSKDLQVGEWVAAFGNPFGHGHSMTKGIVSSKGREIGEINKIPLLQTDASINPGNSGGPLVNTRGLVIGVNSAIDARAQGIGFAIPIDEVKALIPQLEQRGSIRRGYIGAALADLNPAAAAYLNLKTSEGAVIANLDPQGPGAKSGLKPDDIVIEFNGKNIKNTTDLMDAVADSTIGQKAKAKVIRRRKEISLNVLVAERPAPARQNRFEVKKFSGQNAPFNLGFSVIDPSSNIRSELGLEEETSQPLVIEVSRNSTAAAGGLRVGDIIHEVNKQPVESAKDVLRLLKKGENTLRILRGNQVLIININSK